MFNIPTYKIIEPATMLRADITHQGRSQDIADARAQHGHTMFVRNSVQSVEAFRRSGTCSVSVRGKHMRLEFCGDT